MSKTHLVKQKAPQMIASRIEYSGPIPHPSILHQYDPATRKIIVAMANRQSSHRQAIEKSVILSNISNEKHGMWISATITCFMIGCGTYLLMNDKTTVGYFLAFLPAIFHAGNFIYNKNKQNDLTRSKKKEMKV